MTPAQPDSRHIEGIRSLEVRWILPGQLAAAVAGWFGRFPAGTKVIEDAYLLDPHLSGAAELIIDMTGTASCHHEGAAAVARAHQRATASGIQLRLAVTTGAVQRVLCLNGLDRLIPVHPSLDDEAITHLFPMPQRAPRG